MTGNVLRAGSATIDITPAIVTGLNAMGDDFTRIHDRLAARALVLENAGAHVALVSLDLLEVGMTGELRARIASRCGIPASAIMIVPTHSHNAPRVGTTPPGGLSREASAESLAYTEEVFDLIVHLVAEAQTALRPARVGSGHGRVDVNVNRDELVDGIWVLGVDPTGPSDKTLTVIVIQAEDTSTIATIVGYAVHPTASLGTRELSADIAGSALSAISAELGGTALWLPGSLGDQDPRRSYRTLRASGRPATSEAVFATVDEQGQAIAKETTRVVRELRDETGNASVHGNMDVLPCPPKSGTDLPPDMMQETVDHVDLRLSTLTIGGIALLGVGAEVSTAAAAEILAASSAPHPVLVSMANERLGYLADDEAFARGSFTARGCPVTQGWLPRAAARLAEMAEAPRGGY